MAASAETPRENGAAPGPERGRLEKIESHLAHLEHLYEQLNQVVLDQGRQLAKLGGQQQRMAQSIQSAELERIKSTNPRPPHYQ